MNDKQPIERNKRNWTWGVVLMIAILATGIAITWWITQWTDRQMRMDLLQQARLVRQSVTIMQIQALTGTETDLSSPVYLKLKTQLANARHANRKCRFIYLMGRRADGAVFFFADSEPIGSKDESPAGQVYEEVSEGYIKVFQTKIEAAEGPVTDRWGKWVSALVPLIDPLTGELIAVLGMDIDAGTWTWNVAAQAALPGGSVIALLLLIVSGIIATRSRADQSIKPIQNRLMIPLVAIMILLTGGGGILLVKQQRDSLNQSSRKVLEEVSGDMETLLAEQSRSLNAIGQVLIQDNRLRDALKAQDRNRLLAENEQIFTKLLADHGLTHFYFVKKDRVCLLRVHNPERYGDLINRFTMQEAERTGKTAVGLEIGPLGTFTLRSVQPVYDGDELIGYLELGKEIEDILTTLHKNKNNKLEIVLAIHKKDLSRTAWEEGMKMLGREADWNRFPTEAIVYSSFPRFPVEIEGFISEEGHGHGQVTGETSFGGWFWRVLAIQVKDVTGSEVGCMIVLSDITDAKLSQTYLLAIGVGGGVVVLSGMFGFLFVLLRRTDRNIIMQQSELSESEERHRAMFEKNRSIQLLINPQNGAIEGANSAACAFYGYTIEQLRQMNILDINTLSPDEISREMEIARSEQRHHFNFKHRLSDGQIRDVEVHSGPIPVENKQWLYSIIHDITDRKRADELLRESESLQHILLANINAGVVIIDKDTHVIERVNKKGMELFGGTEAQIVGNVCHCFLCPEEKGCCPVTDRGQDVDNSDRILLKSDGSYLPILKSVRHIQINGKDKLLETFIDISDRKQAEEKLKENETNFRTFFNSIDDFLFVLDEQANMIKVNDTVIRRLEFQENALMGQNILMLHPEERRDEASRVVGEMLAGTADFCPVPLISKSGHCIQVETRVYSGSWDGKPALFGVTKDITKIKKTEELFSKAFQTGSSMMAISEIESGRFINVNKVFLDTLGYTLDEVIGKTSMELNIFNNPEDRTRILTMVKESGVAKNVEVAIRVTKGEPRIGLFSVSQITVGEKPCWLTTMTDITDRKQMENSLLEQRSRLDLALQSARMGAWHWDLVDNKRYFDTKVCQLLGINPESFNGTAEQFFNVVHPDDREMLKEALTRTIDQDMPYEPEYRTVWPDGSIHYISAHGRLVRDDSGQPVKIIGLIGDITESKFAQQSLEKERQRLANVIQGTHAGIWEWNVQTGESIFNQKWAELIGYTLEELSPVSIKTWTSFVHPEDLKVSSVQLEKHFSGELPYYDCQCRMKHKNGHWVWVHDRGQVITWTDDGKPLMMFGTHMDITKAKLTEKELMETNFQLEEATARSNQMATEAELANIAKSEFLANMSHEIRTPMNGVIGMTGLLMDTELTNEQRRYAKTVQASGESLLGLINDILDFSKIEAGKLDLEIMAFDLQDMLDDFAVTLALKAHDKGLEFVCAAAPQVPTRLKGDPGRLRQILTNLAGNAVKFTHKGEVVVRIMLESETDKTVLLRFSVKDTGIGIPKDKLGLLFDKFTQADASTTRQYGGTGLGLAISRQLAELMGGKAGVESIENEGSEFWFTVHLEKQTDSMKPEIQIPADLFNTKVLIVDDNAANREILTTRLTAWGMRPTEARDGHEALSALLLAAEEENPFMLAIIDMLMPGMDGEALGRAIKSDKRLTDTRMVMLTSMGTRGDASRFSDIGFNAYLTKPVRHQDLHRALCLALGENHGPEQMVHPIVTRHTDRRMLNRFKDRKARILLAEDNITNQQVALGILKKIGLRADAVANGEEALKALETLPYDLVLMDVQMPVMNGLEATRKIRDPRIFIFNHNIPIIAMTANAMQGDREKCIEAGMNDYVSKPVSPQALATVLDQWLMGQQQQDQDVKADEIKTPVKTDEKIQEDGDSPLAVFNRTELLNRLMGDEDLLQTVIVTFLDDIPIQLADIKESVMQENADRVGSLAHKIKGAAANISGNDFSRAAHEMEIAGKAGNITQMKELLLRLENEFVRLKNAMMFKD